MKRLCAAGAALALVLTAPAGTAQAHPRHDRGVIVYVSDRASVSADDPIDEIYALDPYTRQVDRLTYDIPGVERWPTISPDGRSLAWVRWGFDDTGALRPDLSELPLRPAVPSGVVGVPPDEEAARSDLRGPHRLDARQPEPALQRPPER